MSGTADSTPELASSDAITALILRIFRANGALLSAGDRLVAELGLTSARWQLLGAIAAGEPGTVAQLARDVGVTRQAVQRIANELKAEDVISFRPNPRHKKAHLVELTKSGRSLFEKAMLLQRPWAGRLGNSLSLERAAEACQTLDLLLDALDETVAATS